MYAVDFKEEFFLIIPNNKMKNPKNKPIIGKWFTTMCKCASFIIKVFEN